MQKVIIIYAIVQLMSTAYGLAVIESIRPMVEKKLKDQGYIQNKNSLYTFNNTFKNIAKALIPFYYLGKAISIISDKSSVDKKVNEEIKSGNYISIDELNSSPIEDVEDTTNSIYKSPYDFAFEEPEKYTARKNDIEIYNLYETPVEFIERVSLDESKTEAQLTPFETPDKIIEHVVVKEKVTKSDIAHAISDLSSNELEILGKKIIELTKIKKDKEFKLKLEKDVA